MNAKYGTFNGVSFIINVLFVFPDLLVEIANEWRKIGTYQLDVGRGHASSFV